MKPENILQADFLDILFDGRNKSYGAYALRKAYNTRLLKSLAGMIALIITIWTVQFIKPASKEDAIQPYGPVIELQPTPLTPKPKEEKQAAPKTKFQPPKASIINTPPLIVEDEDAGKPVPAIDDLQNKIIGKENAPGDLLGDEVAPPDDREPTNGQGDEVPVKPEPMAITSPLMHAEIMPEFPGGMEAFKKFMLRHLKQPDDLAEGEKVVVKVRFVVDADGTIQNAFIMQSGNELDKEVLRVLGKMPRWKPGQQNGRFVPVYFTLPVTFLGPEM